MLHPRNPNRHAGPLKRVSRIWQPGQRIVPVGATSSYVPFLDSLTVAPEFAWSVWQPESSVTTCVTLRRSSDNDEEGFGYVNGYLDTASIVSWLGASSMYIVTFHGYGRTATWSVSADQQPFSLTGGVDGQAAAQFIDYVTTAERYNLSANIVTINDYNLFVAARKVNGKSSTVNSHYHFTTTSGGRAYILFNEGGGTSMSTQTRPNKSHSFGTGAISADSDYLAEICRTGSSAEGFINNSSLGTGLNTDTRSISHLFGYHNEPLNTHFNSELIFFKSKLGTTDRNAFYDDYKLRFNKTI